METQTVNGKVELFTTHNTTKTGAPLRSPRYEIGVNGHKYSTFDTNLVQGLQGGDNVQLDLEKGDGEMFWQIKGLKKVDLTPTTPIASPPETKKSLPTLQPSVPQNFDETPQKTVMHMVLSDLSDEELRLALNKASENFGSQGSYGGLGVFASTPTFYDTGLKNSDGSKIYKWSVVIYVRQ